MRLYFRVCAALAVLTALGFVLPAVVGQQPGSAGPPPGPQPGGGAPPVPQPAAPQQAVKVFRMQRGDPEAVVTALNSLLDEPPSIPALPGGAGAAPGGGIGFGGGGVGFGGQPGGLGFGALGAPQPGGLGFGGVAVGQGQGVGFCGTGLAMQPQRSWRAAVQARTQSVVVRGTDRQLRVASDVVAILDRPADGPLPKLQVVQAYPLKHATAEELAGVIGVLDFGGVRLATPEEKLLAAVTPDDAARTIAQLVKELDVPDSPNAPKAP